MNTTREERGVGRRKREKARMRKKSFIILSKKNHTYTQKKLTFLFFIFIISLSLYPFAWAHENISYCNGRFSLMIPPFNNLWNDSIPFYGYIDKWCVLYDWKVVKTNKMKRNERERKEKNGKLFKNFNASVNIK